MESLLVPGSVKRQSMQCKERGDVVLFTTKGRHWGAPGLSHLAGSVAAAGECVRGGGEEEEVFPLLLLPLPPPNSITQMPCCYFSSSSSTPTSERGEACFHSFRGGGGGGRGRGKGVPAHTHCHFPIKPPNFFCWRRAMIYAGQFSEGTTGIHLLSPGWVLSQKLCLFN